MKRSSVPLPHKFPMQISAWLSPLLAAVFAITAPSAQAALSTGTVLTMTTGTCPGARFVSGVPLTGQGSCFGMEVNTGFNLQTNISSYNGVIIGAKQSTLLWDGTATSHTGAIDDSEQLTIDTGWGFFGNTGLHQFTTEPTVITADTVLGFSGWNVSWNFISSIPMNSRAQAAGYTDGQAQITCSPTPCADESAYTLGYSATVPLGDPSGFGNVKYGLRLEGIVKVPGSLSTDATSLSVGSCATTVSSSDGRLSETNLTTCSVALDSNSATSNYHTRLFYDFTVNISASPGGNARVVIPLSAKLPSDTVIRLYKTATSAWATFAEDSNNIVSSAAGSLDSCPAAGSGSYTTPPTKGHYCLQLTIQDNATNDNNASLGAIAARLGIASGTTTTAAPDTRTSSTSGCSIGDNTKLSRHADWWLVLTFIGWLAFLVSRRKSSN